MKVLLINTVPTGKNGITNVIFNYLRAIETTKIKFDYVSLNQPDQIYIDVIENKGGKVFVNSRKFSTIITYFKNLKKIIAAGNYDVVHIHANSHTVVLELLAIKMAGCKNSIVHSHNTTCKYVLMHKILTPLFNSLYSHGLACGRMSGEWMFGNHDFKVINNGIDTVLYSFNPEIRSVFREKIGVGEQDILLGHVGSFIPVKNQSFIIDILKELKSENDAYKLLLIGDGFLRPHVESKVKQFGLSDSVIFIGNIDNVYDYLNAMDLVVMPSFYEGLPLTLIEQQANGLQCVIADTITDEVKITDNIVFLSLNMQPVKWAQVVKSIDCKSARLVRSQVALEKIKQFNYSIQEEAKKLELFYLEITQ